MKDNVYFQTRKEFDSWLESINAQEISTSDSQQIYRVRIEIQGHKLWYYIFIRPDFERFRYTLKGGFTNLLKDARSIKRLHHDRKIPGTIVK